MNSKYKNVFFKPGIPPHEFFDKAWADEPLTKVLKDTNISFALPMPTPELSLVATNENNEVIGQRSTNKVVEYWDHLSSIDSSKQNDSTQTFVKIHQKAVKDEMDFDRKKYSTATGEAFHNAGVAILPEYRGQGLGKNMTVEQLELLKAKKGTRLYCETTNKYSAQIMEQCEFEKITKYTYKDLARELECEELNQLDDDFTVWCKKI